MSFITACFIGGPIDGQQNALMQELEAIEFPTTSLCDIESFGASPNSDKKRGAFKKAELIVYHRIATIGRYHFFSCLSNEETSMRILTALREYSPHIRPTISELDALK